MARATVIGWITIGTMFAVDAANDWLNHGKATVALDIAMGVLLFSSLILWGVGSKSNTTSARRWVLSGIVAAVLIVLYSVAQSMHAIP